MTPPGVRLPATVAALLVAAGCVAAGCAAAPASPPAPEPPAPAAAPAPASAPAATAADAVQTLRFVYRGGQVTGDTGTVTVPAGRTVRIEVASDTAEQVHLHGYDKEAAVPAGGSAAVELRADIPGEFELEFHGSGDKLATLQVR